MTEEFDNIEEFEAHETARVLPIGWLILYIGLILWGFYYMAAYLPQTTGWTQEGAYEESLEKEGK